jgi:hypothetical protein
MAKGKAGMVWYEAGDLHDEDDIACFAVIDSLTRLLPSCRGGILKISTSDIRLLWGVGGPRAGAWSVVEAVCTEYGVKLQGQWLALRRGQEDPFERFDPKKVTVIVPPRDRDVVDSFVNKFMQLDLNSNDAYRCMLGHLLQVTT